MFQDSPPPFLLIEGTCSICTGYLIWYSSINFYFCVSIQCDSAGCCNWDIKAWAKWPRQGCGSFPFLPTQGRRGLPSTGLSSRPSSPYPFWWTPPCAVQPLELQEISPLPWTGGIVLGHAQCRCWQTSWIGLIWYPGYSEYHIHNVRFLQEVCYEMPLWQATFSLSPN